MGAKKENAKEKKKISLTSKIFIALIVGAVTGMVLHYLVPDGNIKNDVIVEVYDSWYEYFRVARELIKDLPIEKIECASELIELATKVLNQGLRPHLKKWQARYRKWYESSVKESDAKLSPQDIQKQYPYYDELLSDLIETSKRMIAYKELMYQIAFHKT